MINLEEIEKLSVRYQGSPQAIAREYCQHIFLSSLYSHSGSEKLPFKGGTALRVIFQSPRFSDDLDFTGVNHITYYEIEGILTDVLSDLDAWGLEPDLKEAKKTTGGYLAKIDVSLYNFKITIRVEISFRQSHTKAQVKISPIKNDYIHTYSITHLPLEDIVSGKIKALLTRSKPRDWYDLYFFLHNEMLSKQHLKELPAVLEKLKRSKMDFKKELKEYLPRNHQMVVKDFKNILKREIEKYL